MHDIFHATSMWTYVKFKCIQEFFFCSIFWDRWLTFTLISVNAHMYWENKFKRKEIYGFLLYLVLCAWRNLTEDDSCANKPTCTWYEASLSQWSRNRQNIYLQLKYSQITSANVEIRIWKPEVEKKFLQIEKVKFWIILYLHIYFKLHLQFLGIYLHIIRWYNLYLRVITNNLNAAYMSAREKTLPFGIFFRKMWSVHAWT